MHIRHVNKASYLVKGLLVAMLVALVAAGPLAIRTGTANAASDGVEKAIDIGMNYLGTPYVFGSDRNTTDSFDCSDLVHYMFEKGAGVSLPTTSDTQAEYVRAHSTITGDWHNLKRGDLMFFMSYHGDSPSDYTRLSAADKAVTHVAVYLGNGRMLQTYSQESGGVRTDSVDGTWNYRFLFGGSAI